MKSLDHKGVVRLAHLLFEGQGAVAPADGGVVDHLADDLVGAFQFGGKGLLHDAENAEELLQIGRAHV